LPTRFKRYHGKIPSWDCEFQNEKRSTINPHGVPSRARYQGRMPKTLSRIVVKAMPRARLDFVSLWSESSDDDNSSVPSSSDEKKPILRKASLAKPCSGSRGMGAEGRTKRPAKRASSSKQMAANKLRRGVRKNSVDAVASFRQNHSSQSSGDKSSNDPRYNAVDMSFSGTWTYGSSTPDCGEAACFSESATFRFRSSPQLSPLYARKLQF
jgi:hypothetical protein